MRLPRLVFAFVSHSVIVSYSHSFYRVQGTVGNTDNVVSLLFFFGSTRAQTIVY